MIYLYGFLIYTLALFGIFNIYVWWKALKKFAKPKKKHPKR